MSIKTAIAQVQSPFEIVQEPNFRALKRELQQKNLTALIESKETLGHIRKPLTDQQAPRLAHARSLIRNELQCAVEAQEKAKDEMTKWGDRHAQATTEVIRLKDALAALG